MPSIRTILTLTSITTLIVLLAACSGSGGGSAKIQPGTPAFFWSSARQAFQAGDYLRASEHLAKLTSSDNEFRTRAEVAQTIVSSGIAQGYLEFAKAYEAGAKANKDKVVPFRKQASAARAQAKGALMQALEALHDLNVKVKDPQLAFELGPPSGSLADIGTLTRVTKGILPLQGDADSAQVTAIRKGVLWSACRAVGSADNAAKAVEFLKVTPAQIPREKFLFGMAQTMFEQSDLYGPKQLDDPIRLKLLCSEAAAALKQVPESKETKDLDTKIQKVLKSIAAT